MKYSKTFKRQTVERLLVPNGPSVYNLAKETGVSKSSLYAWLLEYQDEQLMEGNIKPASTWSLLEKQETLLEAAALSDEELGAWLRKKGLHSEHLELWQKELKSVLSETGTSRRKEMANAKKQIKLLEKELRKKDKALAEVTALLVLKKKLENLLVEEEK